MKYIRFMDSEGDYQTIIFDAQCEHKMTAMMLQELFEDCFSEFLMCSDAGRVRRGKTFVTYDRSDTLSISYSPDAGVNMSKDMEGKFGFIQTVQGFLLTNRELIDCIVKLSHSKGETNQFPLLCGYVQMAEEPQISPMVTKISIEIEHNPQKRRLHPRYEYLLGQFFSYT